MSLVSVEESIYQDSEEDPEDEEYEEGDEEISKYVEIELDWVDSLVICLD
jgi:hypothetical protein